MGGEQSRPVVKSARRMSATARDCSTGCRCFLPTDSRTNPDGGVRKVSFAFQERGEATVSQLRFLSRRLPFTDVATGLCGAKIGGALICLVMLLAPLLVNTGCHSTAPMRTLGIDVRTPEKDVLIYDIAVEEPTDPRSYRDWALERLEEVAGEPTNELYPGLPIYEVWYRFRFRGEITAEVIFRRSDDGTGPLQHVQTMIQNLPDEFRGARSQ